MLCSICSIIDIVQHLRYMVSVPRQRSPLNREKFMARQRCFRLVTFLLFVSVTFLPAYGQGATLSGFDDYVNKALLNGKCPGLQSRL